MLYYIELWNKPYMEWTLKDSIGFTLPIISLFVLFHILLSD